ncbi:MAG TPA: hypothetical protein VJN18_35705 [Polyangiaceae bacterium]|nr:hypothetical protein [Polyangiaceae bacterium]
MNAHGQLTYEALDNYPNAQASFAELLRRDWAVRVLDAWHEWSGLGWHMIEGGRDTTGVGDGAPIACSTYRTSSTASKVIKRASSPDAARLAAAEAVWPELPESVRAELGERP